MQLKDRSLFLPSICVIWKMLNSLYSYHILHVLHIVSLFFSILRNSCYYLHLTKLRLWEKLHNRLKVTTHSSEIKPLSCAKPRASQKCKQSKHNSEKEMTERSQSKQIVF